MNSGHRIISLAFVSAITAFTAGTVFAKWLYGHNASPEPALFFLLFVTATGLSVLVMLVRGAIPSDG
jgi:hypothetical protein